MVNKTKYSTRRKTIRMSWNKFNVFNLKTLSFYYKNKKKKNSFKLKRKKLIKPYKLQLLSKQLLKNYYGRLREKQLKLTFLKAQLLKGSPAKNLLILLESRLDSVLFRMNFASSIYLSRQLINHGHISVNGVKVDKPSYILKMGDIIQVKSGSFNLVKRLIKKKFIFVRKKKYKKFLLKIIRKMLRLPKYLEVNYKILAGIFIRKPKLKEIPYPVKIKTKKINLFYTRA